jgi:hypothetical protein
MLLVKVNVALVGLVDNLGVEGEAQGGAQLLAHALHVLGAALTVVVPQTERVAARLAAARQHHAADGVGETKLLANGVQHARLPHPAQIAALHRQHPLAPLDVARMLPHRLHSRLSFRCSKKQRKKKKKRKKKCVMTQTRTLRVQNRLTLNSIRLLPRFISSTLR